MTRPTAMRAAMAAMLLAPAACATIEPAGKSAVDYNRAFARARDEIIVLNVLRAAHQQPLQFSTISAVQGGMRNNASLRVPFTNVIAGGSDAISPDLTISTRNPSVSIVPLATREFVQGISRPIEAQLIGDLLSQGWSKDVVLPLVIGGVVCATQPGRVIRNSGEDGFANAEFLAVLMNTKNFSLTEPGTVAELRMSSRDAMAFIKDGAGPGNRIRSVKPVPGNAAAPQEALVEVVSTSKVDIAGLDFDPVCGKATPRRAADGDPGSESARAGHHGVLTRSVLGIFRYLGRSQWHNIRLQFARCGREPLSSAEQSLFNIRVTCGGITAPVGAVVKTEFQGRGYFIPPATSASRDRTLETLSLLSYLVELQTSESSLRATSPFVAITQ